jgi:hypothetical protein
VVRGLRVKCLGARKQGSAAEGSLVGAHRAARSLLEDEVAKADGTQGTEAALKDEAKEGGQWDAEKEPVLVSGDGCVLAPSRGPSAVSVKILPPPVQMLVEVSWRV